MITDDGFAPSIFPIQSLLAGGLVRCTVATFLILTSCAVVPTTSAPTETEQPEAGAAGQLESGQLAASQLAAGRAMPAAGLPEAYDSMPLRVGIEYLPAENDSNRSRPGNSLTQLRIDPGTALLQPRTEFTPLEPTRVRAVHSPSAGVDGREFNARERDARTRRDDSKVSWFLTEEEIDAIPNTSERLTRSFVQDLVGEDRRRMQRELRTPILTNPIRYSLGDSLWVPADDLAREEQADFLNQSVSRLLRRPLRNLLKRATIVRNLELALEEFKADNVPLSSAYREDHPDRRRWGRVSLRLRLSDGSDPAEISYYNSGWRIGSGKEKGRLQYRYRFGESLSGSVGYRFNYESHDTSIRADLRYDVNERTSVYMLMGDRLDFLGGPTAYSLVSSPFDGTPGVLFYVEHLF